MLPVTVRYAYLALTIQNNQRRYHINYYSDYGAAYVDEENKLIRSSFNETEYESDVSSAMEAFYQ